MNTFPKQEKLCGQIRIASLYKEGKRFVAYPMRVTCKIIEDSTDAPKVLIWAPKSLFKHAVDRNHARRLMREAYRLNAEPLRQWCTEHGCSMQLAFNYMDKEIRPQQDITKAMRKAIHKLCQADQTPQS